MLDILVMYPNSDEVRFDDTYYFDKHASLIISLLEPLGLKYLRIAKGIDQDAPYYLVAHLGFESQETFQKAIEEAGDRIFDDISNFTNIDPLIQVGEVVANNNRY
ncbi:EthD family reductase [Halomonas sp. M20]|uniref:EthD family reductase n=1 Tax=Halomonas sp. M20 TaxID=2763264 RepID=UPI001D0A11B2|nr:EthD family reductase [Halomonas sp. M20]